MHRKIVVSFPFLVLPLLVAFLAAPKLAADDAGGDVEFTGIIQSLPQATLIGDWHVGGTTVHVSSSTELDQENGSFAVNACVEVSGTARPDSSVDATKIGTEDPDKCGANDQNGGNDQNSNQGNFSGSVQGLPMSGLVGDWVVSGKTVHVAQTTEIDQEKGPVSVGSCVEIEGTTNPDGSVTASQIDVQSASGGCVPAPQNENDELEFSGVVQTLPAGGSMIGDWVVSGRTVHVSATTELETGGTVAVGSCVEVKGTMAPDGSVNATKLDSQSDACQGNAQQPEQPDFVGTIDSLPTSGPVGDWSVSKRIIHVTAATEIETDHGAAVAGACVEVEGALQADNSILASDIQTEDPSRCTAMAGDEGNFEMEGVVQSIPTGGAAGAWKISGRTVSATPTTVLDTQHGSIMLGACVGGVGTLQTDGVLRATRIVSRSSSGICLSEGGVISAASLSGASVTPGEMVSLFGFNIGTQLSVGTKIGPDGRVVSQLSNVRVLFDGVAAPLLFVSSRQVNAVVPFEVSRKPQTVVQVENNGAWSNTLTLPVKSAAPSVFTLTQSGRGQAAVLNYDPTHGTYSVNRPSNAAARGSTVVIFATGAGQTNPPGEDGRVSSAQWLPKPIAPVTVTIGGQRAQVTYAGAAPGMVSGVLQVNVKVPANTPVGASIPVAVLVGALPSQNDVVIAIR